VHLRNLCSLTFLSSLFNWAHFYAYELSIGTPEATQLQLVVSLLFIAMNSLLYHGWVILNFSLDLRRLVTVSNSNAVVYLHLSLNFLD